MSLIRVRPMVCERERVCVCVCVCVRYDVLISTVMSRMRVFTKNGTLSKPTKSRNSNSSVQIQMKSRSQFEFVPRDTEESEFLDLVGFGGDAFSVETVI